MSSLLLTDRRCLLHETGTHPECPGRLKAIWERLGITKEVQTHDAWTRPFEPAPMKALQAIHDHGYLERVEAVCRNGGGYWDADTMLTPNSFDVARLAAGAGMAAVDAVMTGEFSNALSLMRPPGHHAVVSNAMGFCLVNNVAIAAQHAIDHYGLKRVLIIDWDVHHGNGTQDICYARNDVYFFSRHRFPLYPFSGKKNEIGTGAGVGATCNLPLSHEVPREEVLKRFEKSVTEFADIAKPELIFISAGFDAHKDDPVGSGGLHLNSSDFAHMTKIVMSLAETHCGGRLVSLLEGGYNIQALAESVWYHWNALNGNDV